MKIRGGFVSNSSSSSFIIAGIKLNSIQDIQLEDLKRGVKYFVATKFDGNEGTVCIDLMKDDELMLEILQDAAEELDFIYDVYEVLATGEEDIDITNMVMPKNQRVSVTSCRRDYYGPQSPSELLGHLQNFTTKDTAERLSEKYKIDIEGF